MGFTPMIRLRLLTAAVLLLSLVGCAHSPPSAEAIAANDPDEAANRQMFAFNQKLDRYFVGPTVGAYIWAVPKFGRDRVHDFLENLWLPITFANDILQNDPKGGGQTLKRLAVNATVGLGGLFDPATSFHISYHRNDFGTTLGVWGVPEGYYMVLPLIGPNCPRDVTGEVADYLTDPLHWVHYKQHPWWDLGHEYFMLLDLRGQTYQQVQGIQRTSVDFYASMRSLYRQSRNAAIHRNAPNVTNLPKF